MIHVAKYDAEFHQVPTARLNCCMMLEALLHDAESTELARSRKPRLLATAQFHLTRTASSVVQPQQEAGRILFLRFSPFAHFACAHAKAQRPSVFVR